MTDSSGLDIATVRDLRRRWKPTKEALSAGSRASDLRIRFHRSCSWIQRAENLPEDDTDGRLTFSWVAFNSMYGRWDTKLREPRGDRQTWREHLDLLFKLDDEQRIASFLESNRSLVSSILDDEYVSKYFWEEPGPGRARQAKSVRHKAKTWYFEKNYPLILERVIERVYFLRCQLLHGAATCGGDLNRDSLSRCVDFMHPFLLTALVVIVDHGVEEDWSGLCYPPIS